MSNTDPEFSSKRPIFRSRPDDWFCLARRRFSRGRIRRMVMRSRAVSECKGKPLRSHPGFTYWTWLFALAGMLIIIQLIESSPNKSLSGRVRPGGGNAT
jgi:hypothetical protein